jgi:putative ABC transport system substrate-binding protein
LEMRRVIALIFVATALIGHEGLAQQPAKVSRIGFLGPMSAPPPAISQVEVFRKALADLGYTDGRNIIIEARWPEGEQLDRLSELAASMASMKVDVIVAAGATAASAAKGATTEIPIVFAGVVNPVATGLVANTAKPEGNVTGATTFDPLQAGAQIEMLKEAFPSLARIAVLSDSGAAPTMVQTVEAAARSQGLEVQIIKVERGAATPDFDGVFEASVKGGAQAVIVISTPVTTPHRRRIAEAAMKNRMPILSPREHADAGGLISFGTGFSEATRRTATFVDKILKGAKPSELPIETVRKHELVINLKTARELDVTLPSTFVSRATEVIQ